MHLPFREEEVSTNIPSLGQRLGILETLVSLSWPSSFNFFFSMHLSFREEEAATGAASATKKRLKYAPQIFA